MLDQLISFGKEQLADKLKKDVKLDDKQVDDTFGVAKDTLMDSLKKEALGGNMGGLLNLFNGKDKTDTSNPIVNGFVQSFAGNLISKLGFSQSMSSTIAGLVTPVLMKKYADKATGEAKDEGGLMSMLGMDKDKDVSGLLSGGLGKTLGGFFS